MEMTTIIGGSEKLTGLLGSMTLFLPSYKSVPTSSLKNPMLSDEIVALSLGKNGTGIWPRRRIKHPPKP
jgi:hypothetical protein